MRLILPFEEISRYVADNYGREVEFGALSPEVFKVTFASKVFLATIRLSATIRIENVEPARLHLSYSANAGVGMIISSSIKMLLKSRPRLAEAVTAGKGGRICVDLARFKKLKPVLEKVRLGSVSARPDGLEIEGMLR